jgi:hypothetical protein
VPAAAVIRERQALFVINGSKGYVGGIINLFFYTLEWDLYYYTRVKGSNKYIEKRDLILRNSRGCEAAKACYYGRLTLRYEGKGSDRD